MDQFNRATEYSFSAAEGNPYGSTCEDFPLVKSINKLDLLQGKIEITNLNN